MRCPGAKALLTPAIIPPADDAFPPARAARGGRGRGARLASRRQAARAPRAAPEEHDLGRFEALTAAAAGEGDAQRRAQLLRDALSLWRGPALAEFREEPFARAAARRLEELRLG